MRSVVFAIALVAAAAPAVAQDDRGATAAGSLGVTSMDSRAELSYVGTFGYRFSRVIGIELEATFVPAVNGCWRGVPLVD